MQCHCSWKIFMEFESFSLEFCPIFPWAKLWDYQRICVLSKHFKQFDIKLKYDSFTCISFWTEQNFFFSILLVMLLMQNPIVMMKNPHEVKWWTFNEYCSFRWNQIQFHCFSWNKNRLFAMNFWVRKRQRPCTKKRKWKQQHVYGARRISRTGGAR